MTTTLVLTRKPDSKITKVKLSQGNGGGSGISIPAGNLELTTSGSGTVKEVKRCLTIERMGGYVQLKPQECNGHVYKTEPYGITFETGNSVVAKLKGTQGNCFRVHGGLTAQERGILIHEAPHVGYLIGCIGPRNLSDRTPGWSSTAHHTMIELFSISPRPSALFVLDW